MRLLNTWTGEFEWHNDPGNVVYAILSHVWRSPSDGGEQSYDDVRNLQAAVREARSSATVALPTEYSECNTIFAHPELSDKIKGFCKVARDEGFRLVWNDACCIDKSSSAELTEAINSMYEWYRLSDICYAYLADVPDGDRPLAKLSMFARSRWHRRGWTLQELIAPERVIFLTQSWRSLGTKMGLALTLERITLVDVGVLTGRTAVTSISVAQRMAWAASRDTTRIEDGAYSLMGIFGVHMAPIYGEGENAFLRLQEEIIKTVPDQTIFAWGSSCALLNLTACDVGVWDFGGSGESNLLASSPLAFRRSNYKRGYATAVTPSRLALTLGLKGPEDVPPLHCVFTPNGVRAHFLCLALDKVPQLAEELWRIGGEVPPHRGWPKATCTNCRRLGRVSKLALLQCEDTEGHLFALPLCQPPAEGGYNSLFVGTHVSCGDKFHAPLHIVRLTKAVLAELRECRVRPAVVEVLIRHVSPTEPKEIPKYRRILPNVSLWADTARFKALFGEGICVAPRSIDALAAVGFVFSPVEFAHGTQYIQANTTLAYYGLKNGSQPSQTIRISLFVHFTCFAEFHVINFVGVPPQHSPDLSDPGPRQTVDPPSYMAQVPPLEAWADFVKTRIVPSCRAIASGEFTVYATHDWDRNPCAVRTLRVALEYSLHTPPGHGHTYSGPPLLYIDISEAYDHFRPVDKSSQGAPAQTGGTSHEDKAPSSTSDEAPLHNDQASTHPISLSGSKPLASPSESADTEPHTRSTSTLAAAAPETSGSVKTGSDGLNQTEQGARSECLTSLHPPGMLEPLGLEPAGLGTGRSTTAQGACTDHDGQNTDSFPSGRGAAEKITITGASLEHEVDIQPCTLSSCKDKIDADDCAAARATVVAGDSTGGATDAGAQGLPGSASSESQRLSSGHPSSPSTTGLGQPDTGEPSSEADVKARYARQDTVDALRRENNALQAQVAEMAAKNTELASQMAAVLTRVDALSTTPAPEQAATRGGSWCTVM